MGAKFFGLSQSFIVGFGVNDDDFEILHSLIFEAGEQFGKIFFLVEGGDDDGKEGACGHGRILA